MRRIGRGMQRVHGQQGAVHRVRDGPSLVSYLLKLPINGFRLVNAKNLGEPCSDAGHVVAAGDVGGTRDTICQGGRKLIRVDTTASREHH